ncbi:BON domain-containing protein [Sinorhizobium numidicum]|uniref:BON domain-containing protein n=1 Tax=Sinorhizobium numidicum TaxID=680248 RepID=A0ABY8CP89_9HYPH|nr:BON domain-containing protein [Sinorhizobium numidicum]WEX74476.1 BON domain-containing protein [Sinorhizobium numidicum]WEX80466.1 BON domain-containing protein [Sinorhizobium numidicum]
MADDWYGRERRDRRDREGWRTRERDREEREERGMYGSLREPYRGDRLGYDDRRQRSGYDAGGRQTWSTDELGYSDRGYNAGGYRTGYYGERGNPDFAGWAEALATFDPYENRPGFQNRSGQEGWPGGQRGRREMGQFSGKGPRGYTRSDDRIKEDVNDRLTDDPWLDASDIEVAVSGGEVTLTGHVSNRQDKRRAEDCAEAVSGVSYVQNNLRIRSQAESTASPVSSSMT